MKPEKIFLFLSLIGIFILLVMSNFNAPIAEGKISQIKTSQHTTIYLENVTEQIIVLNTKINLKIGTKIKVYGSKQEDVIFATKIICTSKC